LTSRLDVIGWGESETQLDAIRDPPMSTKAKLEPDLWAWEVVGHFGEQRISETTARDDYSPALESYGTSIPIDVIY